jgi:uncharacterized protein YjbJ (UPF0337 family)
MGETHPIKGRIEEGKAKEVTGRLMDNEDMELKGNLQKTLEKSKQASAISRKILRKASSPIIFRTVLLDAGSVGHCRTAICRREETLVRQLNSRSKKHQLSSGYPE